jgi:hypothetical protein
MAYKRQRQVLRSAKSGKFTVRDVTPVIRGVHVLPKGTSRWVVKKIGLGQPSRVFALKERALLWAKELADSKSSAVYVHQRNGHVTTSKSARSTARKKA